MDNVYNSCPPKMNDSRFLTDFRSANTREQYVKTVNNFVRDDDYRVFLQQNAENIIDRDWNYMKDKSCKNSVCIHKFPTRVTQGNNFEEMSLYNSVRTGKLSPSSPNFPSCPAQNDYRISDTKGVRY